MDRVLPTPNRVADRFAGWCWPQLITDRTEMRLKSYALLAASYLTDPICKAHEYAWQIQITKQMQPTATKAELAKTKIFLFLGRIACAVAAIPATVPGVVIRSLASYFQHEPYIHLKGTAPAKTLQGNEVTLYSANLANLAGGYGITDGGVAPWTYRIDAQINEIKQQAADVLCLTELLDPSASFYLYEELKKLGYTDFYFNTGFKAIAPGAGLFIASKYAIHNPQFVAYPEATLQGRTKWACKGFFRFDIASRGNVLARFYTTHLQHSEEPEFPNRNEGITDITEDVVKRALTEDLQDDVIARAAQMHLIVQDILKKSDFKKAVILTGDLNLDEAEKECSFWKDRFYQGTLHYEDKKTWGGDKFCVDLVNGPAGTKRVSQPRNLDYTFMFNDSAVDLKTWLVDSGFDGKQFKPDALSDHSGLKSVITLWD